MKTCLLTGLRLSGCRSVPEFSVMYRPPNDRKFFDLIMSPLERAWLKTSNIIFLGDFDLKSISTTKCDTTVVKLLHTFEALNLQKLSRNQEKHYRQVH